MATYPKVSLAAVLKEYDQPLVLEELVVPPLEPGAVLMKVECATVCGTDVHIQRGRLPGAQIPLIAGHESVGTVIAMSGRDRDANDQPISAGDRIVFSYPWCGSCYWCTIAGQPTLCEATRMYGWGPMTESPHLTGTFSELVYVRPECNILRVPEELDPAVVASTTCALRTIMHGFERLTQTGPVLPTDTVAIMGSGAVGLYATAVARRSGAAKVILLGAPQDRLEIGSSWGADQVVDITATSAEERRDIVMCLTNGRGADIVLDCAGPVAAFEEAMELTRRGGRVVEIGIGTTDPGTISPYYLNIKMISVTGSVSGAIRHYHRALGFVRSNTGTFDFGLLNTRGFALSDINLALAGVESQEYLKPYIEPSRR
ncbi:MAG: alcohol dehydrogenase [Armatimonadetes bacterium]|nr:MAG: alcohol dehydrogenase [Armatimonadota bacterium]